MIDPELAGVTLEHKEEVKEKANEKKEDCGIRFGSVHTGKDAPASNIQLLAGAISLYDNYLPFYYQLLLNYFSPIGKKYFSGRRK